jgi:predicted glycosyltransferase involved in capsule biosynthesis
MEKLSLIMPYRDRKAHLQTQIQWWKQQPDLANLCEILLIELSEEPSAWIQNAIQATNFRYLHLQCSGTFHKTKALNLGLATAQGNWIVAYDVDLIPIGETLLRHWQIAQSARSLLISGYRIMAATETIDITQMQEAIAQAAIAPEDMPTALWKHLTRGERFGVLPFFQRQILEQIGGWDEGFIGWGGEDQDLIERYKGYSLCRSPELVYLHLQHEAQTNWNEAEWVEQNRKHYYSKPRSHQS